MTCGILKGLSLKELLTPALARALLGMPKSTESGSGGSEMTCSRPNGYCEIKLYVLSDPTTSGTLVIRALELRQLYIIIILCRYVPSGFYDEEIVMKSDHVCVLVGGREHCEHRWIAFDYGG